MHTALSSRLLPLNRYVPAGLSWMYDVQRMADGRKLGPIFDVGANVGQTAEWLVRYFPHSPIYCFEPVRSSFEELQRRYGGYPNVTLVQNALGSAPGETTIDLSENSELNTLMAGGPTQGALSGRRETLQVETIDRFCESRRIEAIDILKLDVQGWELKVLEGMSLKPRFIYAEVGFRESQRDMQYFGDFHRHMESAGYDFCGLYDVFRYGPAKGLVGFASALYCNR